MRKVLSWRAKRGRARLGIANSLFLPGCILATFLLQKASLSSAAGRILGRGNSAHSGKKPYWEPKLDEPPPTQAPPVNSTEETPTGQPPTRGQDEQLCAFVELPDDIMLSPKLSDKLVKHGNWQSLDGAEFVQWSQDLFTWSYDMIYLSVMNNKILAKMEVIQDVELQLPGYKIELENKKEGGEFTVIALKDCSDQLLYVFHEHKDAKHSYRIFNRDEKLVAQIVGGNLYYDQLHIYDDKMIPIGIVQSPFIVEDSYNAHVRNRPDADMGGVPSYELRFVSGYNSNSSMLLPQNRWVLAAAIQERACRNSLRFDGGYPPAYPWFLGLAIFAGLVFVGVVVVVLHMIFRCVYPKLYPEIENVFLQSTLQRRGVPSYGVGKTDVGKSVKGR